MTELAREPMSPEEYVAYGGIRCPFCMGVDLDSQGVELYEGGGKRDVYQGGVSQEVGCDVCGKEWFDSYELKGWEPCE